MGLGRQIVKELDLKLTLGMAERRLTECPPDEESWGGGHPLSDSGCFLSNRSQYRLNIAWTLNKDQKEEEEENKLM